MNKKIVFTGGPGSGKTSVIAELTKLGYITKFEVGRELIVEQTLIGGEALPWKNRRMFAQEMYKMSLSDWKDNCSEPLVFFDRSIVDTLGYCLLEKLDIPLEWYTAVEKYPYSSPIFIFPPWKQIYCNDSERKQNYATAVQTYNAMVAIYSKLDYELIEVPKESVEHRVEWILDNI